MKTLKFRPYLVESILKEEKNTSWRLFDDKDISEGEDILLINWKTGKEFGQAKVISVRETTFEKLNDEDKQGHEEFESDEEMYKEYSKYYKRKIGPKTKLKVIKFKLK